MLAGAERIELPQQDLESRSPDLGTFAPKLADGVGIEPTTNGLTDRRSTAELSVNLVGTAGLEPATFRLSVECSTN